jgi:hypothetical protein
MRDYRKSLRHATPASCAWCELTLENVVLPALLLNESRKGFGVLVAGMPLISVNQSAQLDSYLGCFDCQIAYVMEVLPKSAGIYKAAGVGESVAEEGEEVPHITAYDIDKFTAITKGPWFRLGIRCLHKIASAAPPDQPPTKSSSRSLTQSIKHMLASIFGR